MKTKTKIKVVLGISYIVVGSVMFAYKKYCEHRTMQAIFVDNRISEIEGIENKEIKKKRAMELFQSLLGKMNREQSIRLARMFL